MSGAYMNCFHAGIEADHEFNITRMKYIHVGAVNVDINDDLVSECRELALININEAENKLRAEFQFQLDSLKKAKANLLSLDHKT